MSKRTGQAALPSAGGDAGRRDLDDGPRLHHRLSSEVAFCFNGELEPARTGDVVRAPTPPPGGLRKHRAPRS